MRVLLCFIIGFVSTILTTATAQTTAALNSQMIEDWDSFSTQYPLAYDQFVFSAYSSPGNFEDYRGFVDLHKNELEKKIKDRFSDKRKAEIIFKYLHEKVFLRYKLNSRVSELITDNTYNCVTATAFFVSMAEVFEIPFQIYETPAHVYAAIPDGNNEIIVELTAPENGFDFDTDIASVLQTLLDSKLISQQELEEKGAEQLFAEYVKETVRIGEKELLAIQYYNDGVMYSDEKEYRESYNKFRKAMILYDNPQFSEAYRYTVSISQLDFTLPVHEKTELLHILLESTREDSLLTYTLIPHFGELIEDLMKMEDTFDDAQALINRARDEVFPDRLIKSKINEYQVYIYTSIAQNASLKGDSNLAKENLEKALQIDPENGRLITYYVSVSTNHALRLAQFGLLETARAHIDQLAVDYPEGYPVVQDAQVRIILSGLIEIPFTQENVPKLLSDIKLAHSIQPENIYLKSFAANVFHELAMQQIRRADYQKAKDYILMGLEYNKDNPTLISDLELINQMVD